MGQGFKELTPSPDLQELPEGLKILGSLAAGATAGAIAKTTVAPLDRCKIYFQTSRERYSTRAAIAYLRNEFNTQGFFALWKGNTATMARIVPYAGIQFSSHEQWKRVLGIANVRPGEHVEDLRKRSFLAGSLAGVTSQSITYPLDIARARMAVTHDEKFGSLGKVFKETYRTEGVRGFYRGYVPTVLGVIPYAGASFFTYELLKREFFVWSGGKTPGTKERLLFGAGAGICGQMVSYPFDVVRRRMQTAVITGRNYKKLGASFVLLAKEEGIIRGYFKGLSMNWIKGPIATGISFATYELVRDIISDFLRR